MNREILFRGKRTDNGEWVYGDLIIPDWKNKYLYNKVMFIKERDGLWGSEIEVVTETVGQFTGLTDKNGKKIFEGEIVKQCCGNTQYTVNFRDGRFIVDDTELFEYRSKEYSTQEAIRSFRIEIIGNKWDNPELLEEREE